MPEGLVPEVDYISDLASFSDTGAPVFEPHLAGTYGYNVSGAESSRPDRWQGSQPEIALARTCPLSVLTRKWTTKA